MPDVTFDRFKTIVAEQLGVEPDQVTPEASFVEDLNRGLGSTSWS